MLLKGKNEIFTITNDLILLHAMGEMGVPAASYTALPHAERDLVANRIFATSLWYFKVFHYASKQAQACTAHKAQDRDRARQHTLGSRLCRQQMSPSPSSKKFPHLSIPRDKEVLMKLWHGQPILRRMMLVSLSHMLFFLSLCHFLGQLRFSGTALILLILWS